MTKVLRIFYYSRTLTAAIAMLCSVSYFAPAAIAEESNVYAVFESFIWREFDDDGSRLLKESGPIFGLGFSYWKEFADHVTLKPTAEIFGGTVDYDGQACSIDPVTHVQTCLPATTDVDYFGFKFQGEAGRRFRSEHNSFIEPFGGLGLRYWLRDINDGIAEDGSPTAGYMEEWITLQARLGVRGGVDISSKKQAFAEAGVQLPIYNRNTAYLSDVGLGSDVRMNPGRQVSFFAETGIKIDRFKGSLFYDSLRFSKSSPVISGSFIYWQPKSTMDVYGIKAGLVF